MKIGILGTGRVGQTLGGKFSSGGHQVFMGSRTSGNETARAWAAGNPSAESGTFREAASFGEIIFHCVKGEVSLEVLEKTGRKNLDGKILVDVTNPLDLSRGMPPSLLICNTESLGERIQEMLPETRVIKAFNTMNAEVMVNPGLLPGDHDLFICGNDAATKSWFADFLAEEIGWKSILDLGDIKSPRGMEMILPIWINLYMKFQSGRFNFRVVRGD